VARYHTMLSTDASCVPSGKLGGAQAHHGGRRAGRPVRGCTNVSTTRAEMLAFGPGFSAGSSSRAERVAFVAIEHGGAP